MKRILCAFLLVLGVNNLFAQKQGSAGYKTNWTINPFDEKLFVENKGQFDIIIPSCKKVLFEAKLGHINAYFTSEGLVYQYEEWPKQELAAGKDPDENSTPQKAIEHYVSVKWEGSNSNVTIEAQQEETQYYTYPSGESGTIKANVFRKIVYRNLYPGIDVEYIFPKGKEGIKYTLIVHPGADIGKVKLKYSGDALSSQLNKTGDVIINTNGMDCFTDHTPISYYSDGGKLNVEYSLNGLEESFSVKGSYDKSKTVIIDPWNTNPKFTKAPNRAYDLDYDNNGNVYVYGGGGPYQLVKLNSAGTIQWTFTNNFFWGREHYYGDFSVDKVTGTSYLVEGVGGPGFGTPADAMKINTVGSLVGTFTGNIHLTEMWRAIYNTCNHDIVIGGGGISYPYQACILDTNMKKITPVNILPKDTMPYHDVTLMAMDPAGTNCYMTTALNVFYDTNYDNVFVRVPIPALSPAAFMVPDGYKFQETNSINYVGTPPGYALENAMNGMGVSLNWVYTYEGYTLKRCNLNTGVITKSLTITPPVITTVYSKPAVVPQWGGLDVDLCDNLYVGDASTINIYDSTLTQTGSILAADTIYDVVLGANYATLYACGVGFVSSVNVASGMNPTIKVTKTQSCGCSGTATATLTLCSNPVANANYLWSPGGQTTQTATGLCAGNYTVAISIGCNMVFKDSVTLASSAGITPTIVGVDTICQGQNTTITAVGGAGATYNWSTGSTASSITVSPVKDSTYKVVVSDTSGCHDTVNVPIVVNPKPIGTVSSAKSVCKGDSVHLLATGGTSYIWKPNKGLSSSIIANPIAYPTAATTYTVFISNGKCWDTLNTTVSIIPPSSASACCGDTIPYGSSTTLHVVPAASGSSYIWTPATGLSCLTCPSPIASPSQPTEYYVMVTDSNGCKSLDSVYIDISGCATIYIPNAFTPNSDGRNDSFYPKGGGCIQYIEMYIFDRWGGMFYHSVNKPWDGTAKGRIVEEDTYVYLIITTDYKGNTNSYMGKVTLLK